MAEDKAGAGPAESRGEFLRRNLSLGSAEIDRMRKEIHRRVKEVMGMILAEIDEKGQFSVTKSRDHSFSIYMGDGKCEWNFAGFGSDWRVSYCLKGCGISSRCIRSEGDIRAEDAQRVYSSLPYFLEEMEKRFPFLTQRWQPILDAAKRVGEKPEVRQYYSDPDFARRMRDLDTLRAIFDLAQTDELKAMHKLAQDWKMRFEVARSFITNYREFDLLLGAMIQEGYIKK